MGLPPLNSNRLSHNTFDSKQAQSYVELWLNSQIVFLDSQLMFVSHRLSFAGAQR